MNLVLYSNTLLIELSPESSPQLHTPGSSNTYISLDLCSSHPDLEPPGHFPSALCNIPLHTVSLNPPTCWPWCHFYLVHPVLCHVLLFRPLASALRWVPQCHLFLTFAGTLYLRSQGMAHSLLRTMNCCLHSYYPHSSVSFSLNVSQCLRILAKHPLPGGGAAFWNLPWGFF